MIDVQKLEFTVVVTNVCRNRTTNEISTNIEIKEISKLQILGNSSCQLIVVQIQIFYGKVKFNVDVRTLVTTSKICNREQSISFKLT